MRIQRRALLLGFVAALLLGSAAWRGGYGTSPPLRVRGVDPRALRVHDGDTFELHGTRLRLLGVDTPERGAPWFDGDQEPWASRAAALVRRELGQARRVVLLGHGRRDPFGRSLVHVLVDDRPLALSLVREGLAYTTVHRFGDQGFPVLSAQLLREARKPAFERPWRWRRAHRIDY